MVGVPLKVVGVIIMVARVIIKVAGVIIMGVVTIMAEVAGVEASGSVPDGVDGRHGGVLHIILTVILILIPITHTIRNHLWLSSSSPLCMSSRSNSIGTTAGIPKVTIRM
jgi:hypothetical protein